MRRELCVVTDHQDIIGLYDDENEAAKDFLDLAETECVMGNSAAMTNKGETKFLRVICNDQVEKARLIDIA